MKYRKKIKERKIFKNLHYSNAHEDKSRSNLKLKLAK